MWKVNVKSLLNLPMKKLAFKNVEFVTSASQAAGYPKHTSQEGLLLPELAVAGRSNVGKSSLLNHLFGVKNLVKTSQKPGKTRLLNFFRVDQDCVFCDLPGYGFANVLTNVKKTWGQMIEHYLLNRECLKGVLLLLDVRRTPSAEDIQFFDWIMYHKIPILLVFTKWDKLSKNAAMSNVQKNLKALNAQKLPKVYYSVPKNLGRKELIFQLKAMLNDSNE